MESACSILPETLKILRKPFEPHQISKKPVPTKAQTEALRADFKVGIRCKECGGWHHKDVQHLDYVGHAALTDRLLDADPCWNWEPVALSPDGTPSLDGNKGMWIRLTICGHTRLGYGHAEGKNGGDAIKEVIGDALRNAAMRFGAALELWHKGDLHIADDSTESDEKPKAKASEKTQPKPAEQKKEAPSGVYTDALKRIAQFADVSELGTWWSEQKSGLKGMCSDAEYADIITAVKNQKADLETPSENPFEERDA